MKRSMIAMAVLFLYCHSLVFSGVPDIQSFYGNLHFSFSESSSGICVGFNKAGWESFSYRLSPEQVKDKGYIRIELQTLHEQEIWIAMQSGQGQLLSDYQKFNIGPGLPVSVLVDCSSIQSDNIELEDVLMTFFPFAGENATSSIEIRSIEIVSAQSITDAQNDSLKLSVYPNPATSYIQIDNLRPGAKLRMFAMDGRLIKDYSNLQADNLRLDVESLPNGNYLIDYSANGQHVQSLIQKN